MARFHATVTASAAVHMGGKIGVAWFHATVIVIIVHMGGLFLLLLLCTGEEDWWFLLCRRH